jgi:AraC-like DNA-binding protein
VRTLRRRVLEAADLSPKSYARMCRFLFAIELMDRRIAASRPEWAALALDAGYCDQSHLVRDFQAICGMTPGAVREERRAEPAVRHETSLVLAEKSNPAAALDR